MASVNGSGAAAHVGSRQRSRPAAACLRLVLHAALRLKCGWRPLLQVVEAVQADLADKVDAGELRRLLEGKAGVEDVNAALLEVCVLSCQG